ncbi:MAG: DUF4340 domain-containing protein [Gemmatimonadota bacterium]
MTDQGLKALVGALAVLLGIWGVATVMGGPGEGSIGASGEIASFFDDLDGPSLVGASITGPAGGLQLAREEGGWTANGFRTDEATIAQFLVAVTTADIGDLSATNPDNHERMGVTDERATRVTFRTEEGSKELLLGDTGRRFQTAYVRLPGEDAVYLLDGDLGSQLRRGADDFRDRVLARVDTASVARLVVERGDGAYTLVRADSSWSFLEGGSTSGTTVTNILSELSNLEATGFYAESDSVAQLARGTTTRAFDAAGAMVGEVVVGEGETDRWARTAGDTSIYRLSAFRAGRLAPSRAEVAGGG